MIRALDKLFDPFWPVRQAGGPGMTGWVNGWIKACVLGIPVLVVAMVTR